MSVSVAALADRARALVARGPVVLLGIAGAPGAGKTTLVEELIEQLRDLPVAHVPLDGFHLADNELDRLGLRDRKGAPETFDAAGYAALLRRVRDRTDDVVYAPSFERVLEQPIAGAIPVPRDTRLVLSEGNYLLLDDPRWVGLRDLFDEIWFVELEPQERLRRLVRRHVRFGKDEATALAWAHGTDERNAAAIAATRDRADLVISGGWWGQTRSCAAS